MSISLSAACENNEFHPSMIPSSSEREIDEAVVWAAQNNKWPLLCALRPHSHFNNPTGALKLIRAAIHRGSKSVLNNTLRDELTPKIFQQHASFLLKEALHSEHICGIEWLLKNKSFFGLKSDHFYFTLTGRHHYLTASKTAVECLTSAIPSDNYDWLYMANKCAENGDIHRCVLYLNLTPAGLLERARSIQETIKKALRHGKPQDYEFLLLQWEALRGKHLNKITNIPQLFAVALDHSEPQNAIEALLKYCGGNHDFRSLGTECSQQIEHLISIVQKTNIHNALDPSGDVVRTRKM